MLGFLSAKINIFFEGGSISPCCDFNVNVAKGTTDLRVEFLHQSICFWVISNFSFKISTKLQLQNLDQTRLQNLDLNSISKSRQNFSFKILTKIQLQSLDKTSLSISWQIFMFKIFTKHQLQNPDQTVVNTFLRINISNTNNIKKGQVGIFNASVTSIKSQQHEFS